MDLAKCLFVRKNVKKMQEKFLLLKSFYYICTRGNLKIRAPALLADLHFPLRAKRVCTRGNLKIRAPALRADLHFPLLSISCEPKSAEGKPSK